MRKFTLYGGWDLKINRQYKHTVEVKMKWIINYVDVNKGDTFYYVEKKCSEGWEPFAVTIETRKRFLFPVILKTKFVRFWFKKPVEE